MSASDTEWLASWLHLGLRAAEVAAPRHLVMVCEAKASLLPLLLWLLHLLLHLTVVSILRLLAVSDLATTA